MTCHPNTPCTADSGRFASSHYTHDQKWFTPRSALPHIIPEFQTHARAESTTSVQALLRHGRGAIELGQRLLQYADYAGTSPLPRFCRQVRYFCTALRTSIATLHRHTAVWRRLGTPLFDSCSTLVEPCNARKERLNCVCPETSVDADHHYSCCPAAEREMVHGGGHFPVRSSHRAAPEETLPALWLPTKPLSQNGSMHHTSLPLPVNQNWDCSVPSLVADSDQSWLNVVPPSISDAVIVCDTVPLVLLRLQSLCALAAPWDAQGRGSLGCIFWLQL